MELASLLIANVLIVVTLLLAGQILAAFFVPRLELAKGINGTPEKFRTIYSMWGLASLWKNREINWRSVWILVLGLQSLLGCIFLGPIFTKEWGHDEKLIVPLVFLFIQILVTGRTHFYDGEKHPNVKLRTCAALVGAMGLATVLYGIKPHQDVGGWLIAGYIIKWLILMFLYLSLVSFLTFEKSAEVPEIVSRLSQVVWSIGLVMIFWPPESLHAASACGEQIIKAQAILFLQDVGRAMFAKTKVQFFENFVMSLVIPLIFLASIIIAMGL